MMWAPDCTPILCLKKWLTKMANKVSLPAHRHRVYRLIGYPHAYTPGLCVGPPLGVGGEALGLSIRSKRPYERETLYGWVAL